MSAMPMTLVFTLKASTAARKIGNNIYLFLKDKLKLPINREKSGIRKPVNFTILGIRLRTHVCER